MLDCDFKVGACNFFCDNEQENADTEDKKTYKIKLDKKRINNLTKIIAQQSSDISEILELKELKEGNQLRIVTTKSFNMVSFLEYFMQNQKQIDNLTIATFNVSQFAVYKLIDYLKKGLILNLTMLACNINNFHERCVESLNLLAREKNTKIIGLNNHTKLMLVDTDNQYYVLEGSGNLSQNARIEQYLIEQNKQMYDFHTGWIAEAESRFPGAYVRFGEN